MGPTWMLIPLLFTITFAMDNLEVAHEWRQLDYAYPSEEAREEAIKNYEFIPQNNLPLGLEVHDERLFITVPRWRNGVAASLNYIRLSDPLDSPKLHPYPSWEAHNLSSDPQIVSPFRIRADKCGRLWVLDTGEEDILGEQSKVHRPTTLLVYDLSTDTIMRTYEIPANQTKDESFFANIAVEDHNCSNTFAYLGDLGDPAIVVYSWKNNSSWRVKHHFFHIDPLMGDFRVSDIEFTWTDGIFGMALSKPDSEGYSILYFHPLTSTHEFAVSTKYLREDVSDNFHKFKVLGNRGPKGQSGSSFLDQKTDVIFYALVNLNAVTCWRTNNKSEYTMLSQGRVYMNNVTMVFPNDIKVDSNDTLWVLSDRLPNFMYGSLDQDDVNFRIFKAKVADAIRGTTCDPTFKVNKTLTNIVMSDVKGAGFKVGVATGLVFFTLAAILSL